MGISIILPAYNAVPFLTETLDSVVRQTCGDWQLIIIDDGSTDATFRIATEYARNDRRIVAYYVANAGEAAARNAGFARASESSTHVIFLDHDDVWEPHALERLYEESRRVPEAMGVHAVGTMINSDGAPAMPGFFEAWCRNRLRLDDRRLVLCDIEDPTDLSTLAYRCVIGTMGICLFRREVLPGLPFRADMRTGSSDLHLYLRLARNGHFHFLDEVLIRKRTHGGNLSGNSIAIDRSRLFALSDVWASPDTTAEARRILQNCNYFRNKQLARGALRTAVRAIGSGRLRDSIQSAREAFAHARNFKLSTVSRALRVR